MDTQALQIFAEQLCKRLDLNPGYLIPGLRGPLAGAGRGKPSAGKYRPLAGGSKTRRSTSGLIPTIARRGLAAVVGFVLPLKADSEKGISWQSSRWPLKHERLYLLPGDSPMGLRLPLNSLPWVAARGFRSGIAARSVFRVQTAGRFSARQ